MLLSSSSAYPAHINSSIHLGFPWLLDVAAAVASTYTRLALSVFGGDITYCWRVPHTDIAVSSTGTDETHSQIDGDAAGPRDPDAVGAN